MGLAINLALVDAANSQSWLTGEEASVAFKDVVFLPLRLQHCRYDTNLGGHLIYDLAFKLHPAPGLWYGRQTKAVLMALAGPLAFLLGRRLGLSVPASLLCGSSLFLFPGFSSFSWLAMEAGLELLFGGLRPDIAAGQRRLELDPCRELAGAWPAGLRRVRGVRAPGLYPDWPEAVARPGPPHAGSALVACGLLAAVLSVPSLWWVNTAHAYRGGGTIELKQAAFPWLATGL